MPAPRSASLVARGATTEIESRMSPRAGDVQLPCLTILYHPDLTRVGERALLAGLDHGKPVALSRVEPRFAHPRPHERQRPRALEDTRLSRAPIELRSKDGGLSVDASRARTPLEVDGEAVDGAVTRGDDAATRGVQLLLGGQVLLLLHRVDPKLTSRGPGYGLVGESDPMLRLRRDVAHTADLDVPVLLLGETGTGKELVARALHDAGPRRGGPYVTLNVAALPPNLAAAELFGAARGAYTGADRKRRGHFQRAHRGTLFLDEIGDLPSDVQVLLLRALEGGEIQPVGAGAGVAVDARLLAATDADLEAAVARQEFRAPLLHRLAGYVIRLPPLRQRPDDFGRLLVHFLRQEAEALGQAHRLVPSKRPWVPAALVARWARQPWPGNVRQLRNAVRQMLIAHRDADVIPPDATADPLATGASTSPPSPADPEPTPASPAPPRKRPRDLTEDELRAALRRHAYELQATASALGISRPSLYDRIQQSPNLHTAADLTDEEVAEAERACDGDLHHMAAHLEVSTRALGRRLKRNKP